MVEQRYQQEEIICQKGDISDKFYIILKGQIQSQIFVDNTPKVIRTFNDGSIVSLMSFLSQQPSQTQLIASQYT